MTTYTINNKPYTEFDINKRCAEIRGFNQVELRGNVFVSKGHICDNKYDPCSNPSDTWPIIERVFDFLESRSEEPLQSVWQCLMEKHNCTKLVAACICLIEVNGGE